MSSPHVDVLLAGAFAAVTVDLLVYPLDTIKTRFQSPDYKKIYYDASKHAINRHLLFRGLYQGVGSVVLITIPSSGAFFTTYEAMKSILNRINPILNSSGLGSVPQPFIHSAASATAELVSCFILTPAEVLKQNAQMIRRPAPSSASKPSTIFQPSVTLQVLKHFKKPSQLWRGYTALAARNLPFTALQFPMFEHLKVAFRQYREKRGTYTGSLAQTATITAISAAIAGSIAAVITTPIDVVKTRIMLSAANESSESAALEKVKKARSRGESLHTLAMKEGAVKRNALEVAREVIGENGIKGLFRGGLLRATWTALGSGLYLGVYESSRAWLGSQREPLGP
ncbi:mitochondrial carrier protein-like protein [Xylogone sp. PMI_703]|nr:mitochondrial carrier protein-like protein [Xylogone sp. PMI_703]